MPEVSAIVEDGFGFYGILTDPVVGYERLATLMVERDVRFIQLRMKETSKERVLAMAKRLRPLIAGPCRLIINDDPEVAAEAGADGVHLGQDDMPIEKARELLGPEAIIGVSTHSPGQVEEACRKSPSYIGVGPVYPPQSKKEPDPVIGIEGMKEMLELATVPAVAIGGIRAANLAEVLTAGAKNFTAVEYINRSSNPARALDSLLRIANRA
jgi:thiamine-phosphate pyrophosphorylase